MEGELDFDVRKWAGGHPGELALWVFRTEALRESYLDKEIDAAPRGTSINWRARELVFPNTARVRFIQLGSYDDVMQFSGLRFSRLVVDTSLETAYDMRDALQRLANWARLTEMVNQGMDLDDTVR